MQALDEELQPPTRRSKSAFRASLLIGLLVAAITAGLGIDWLLKPDPPLQSRRRPDGARVDLLGWTLGNSHEFFLGVRWQKLLWPLLPPAHRDRLTSVTRMYRQSPPPNSLILWTRRTPTDGNFLTGRHMTVDEHGCELTAAEEGSYGFEGSGDELAEPWAINTFPRRGSTVVVRHLEQNSEGRPVPFAEFTIPNPDPGPHPEWSAPPLPVSVVRDDLTFTLTGLRTRLRERFQRGYLPSGEEPWTQASFRIRRKGRTADRWHVKEMIISDATGNVWKSRRHAYDMSGDAIRFDVDVGLCTRETYRVRVEFTHDGEVDASDLIRIPGLTIPERGNIVPLGRTFQRRGATVTLKEVIGPLTPFPDWSPEVHRDPIVAFTVGPEEWSQHRLKRYRDPMALAEWGEELSDPGMSSSKGEYWFRIRERPIPKRLDLVVAVRKSYFVEFLARAAAPEPPKPGQR